MSNFYEVTDIEGKMPVLCRGWPSHPAGARMAYVKYVSDRPVEVLPYLGQDRVYDYADQEFLSLKEGVKTWDGKDMPLYRGVTLENSYAKPKD